MTTHTPAIEISHDQPSLPNQPFSPWLRGQTTLFISQISAILGFVLFLASLVYYVSHLGEPTRFLRPVVVKLIVDYAHVVFMAVFILVLIQVLDDNDRGHHRVKLVYERVFGEYDGDYELALEKSKEQLKLFKRRFLWFWVGMLFLYVFFTCQHSYQLMIAEPARQTSQSVDHSSSSVSQSDDGKDNHTKADLSHGATNQPGTSNSASRAEQGTKRLNSGFEISKELAFPFIVFFFNNLTLLFIFWCFVVLHIPSNEMAERYLKYRNASLLIVGMLTLMFPLLAYLKGEGHTVNEWMDFSAVFDALSGVINALVLALLVARLDSKLIGLPSWLISILYSYAAVQPLFMVFELNESAVLQKIATSVLIFVFVSKIYFFLIIIYALQTGKMLNYLFCFPILRERAKLKTGSASSVSERAPTLALELSDDDKLPTLVKDSPTRGRLMRILDGFDKYVYGHLTQSGKKHLARTRQYLSRWLRSDNPLKISKWLGLVAICYFFVSLIVFLVIPSNTNANADAGGLRAAASRIKDAYVQLLVPNNTTIEWKSVFDVVIDSGQILFVLGMIVTLYLVRNDNHYHGDKALKMASVIFKENLKPKYPPKEGKKQLRKFKEYYLYFWCVVFLLYVVFLLDHLKLALCLDSEGSIVVTSSVLAFTSACGAAPAAGSMEFMARVLLYPFLEFLLSTLNLLFIFWCFVILRSPAFSPRAVTRQKRLINSSAFVIGLLVAVFPILLFLLGAPNLTEANMLGYATVFVGVTGTLSAVVLALLIARMDSKLFGLPPWSIWMLFAYASIQPLFVAFALKATVLSMVQTSVLTAALGLKICFFLIIAHSLQSGRVLKYLVCFPFLKDRVDSIFDNQFEIRLVPTGAESDLFTIQILKKNELRYSTQKRFKNRSECDTFVHHLREQMKEHSYLLRRQKSGTHWVELRADELICESLGLRSKEEAHALMRESRDKIPYCKYNRA